jgi:hypothetical protein
MYVLLSDVITAPEMGYHHFGVRGNGHPSINQHLIKVLLCLPLHL